MDKLEKYVLAYKSKDKKTWVLQGIFPLNEKRSLAAIKKQYFSNVKRGRDEKGDHYTFLEDKGMLVGLKGPK